MAVLLLPREAGTTRERGEEKGFAGAEVTVVAADAVDDLAGEEVTVVVAAEADEVVEVDDLKEGGVDAGTVFEWGDDEDDNAAGDCQAGRTRARGGLLLLLLPYPFGSVICREISAVITELRHDRSIGWIIAAAGAPTKSCGAYPSCMAEV